MSTGIYKTNQLLYDNLKAVGFNAITFGDANEIDLKAQSIYPFAHVNLVDRNMNRSTEVINYQIIILDTADSNDLNPRDMLNDFRRTDNTEDIFQDLGYRFNKAYQTFLRDNTEIYAASESITLGAFYAKAGNKLVGYEANISITIPNLGIC